MLYLYPVCVFENRKLGYESEVYGYYTPIVCLKRENRGMRAGFLVAIPRKSLENGIKTRKAGYEGKF